MQVEIPEPLPVQSPGLPNVQLFWLKMRRCIRVVHLGVAIGCDGTGPVCREPQVDSAAGSLAEVRARKVHAEEKRRAKAGEREVHETKEVW